MSHYIHFTEEQKTQARQTDLVDLLHRQGEKLKRSGSEYEWRDGSQKVTIRGNLWFHQYERVGGDAVDFVRKFYNKSYPDAVEFLLAGASAIAVGTANFVDPMASIRVLEGIEAYLDRHGIASVSELVGALQI